jgi:hypothetical protein
MARFSPRIVGLRNRAQIEAMLEGLVGANLVSMRGGSVPSVYGGTIRYLPEAVEGARRLEEWRTASEVARIGAGDCEDLAAYAAAQYRHSGRDPGARAVIRQVRPGLMHALVLRSNGSLEDPSKRLGMKGRA